MILISEESSYGVLLFCGKSLLNKFFLAKEIAEFSARKKQMRNFDCLLLVDNLRKKEMESFSRLGVSWLAQAYQSLLKSKAHEIVCMMGQLV